MEDSAANNVQFDSNYRSPLIFDESFDFTDPLESRFEAEFSDGLLAKSEALLSMSAYEKSPQSGLLGYDATRTLHEPVTYAAYAQPPYVTHFFPSSLESDPAPDGLSYMTSQEYNEPSPFDVPPSPILGVQSSLVEISSYSPHRGFAGGKLYVYFCSVYDILARPSTTFTLEFGTKRCECTVQSLGPTESTYQYGVSAVIPPFISTGYPSLAIPIQLIMGGQDGQGPETVHVGVFTYDDENTTVSPVSDMSRKRKNLSVDESRAVKKTSVQQIQIKEDVDSLSYDSLSHSPYSPYLSTPTSANVYPVQQSAGSPGLLQAQFSGNGAASYPAIRAPSPLASSWGSSYAASSTGYSPNASMTAPAHPQPLASPLKPANPMLIRTSTIQQSSVAGQPHSFNPYAMYPSKAVLKLNGDLDSMAENWTPEECKTQRRLVHFTRQQNGSAIHADFKPVTPEDRQSNSICISCIWWEGKKECFVTSVDTIYLLESLVAVRFTVEEKNRIRRNLEGFRPLTVSKAKADSEDFFKVIMGFPNPKPRNIEKDVKVFPWKILAHALKKIIGKYSASYSSTAGALPPSISTYKGTGRSDATSEPHHTASPRSASESTPSSTYASSLASTTLSPHIGQTKPAFDSPSVTGSPDFRVSQAPVSHSYTTVSTMYPYNNGLTAPVKRGSWDFAAFVDTSPTLESSANSHPFSFSESEFVPAAPVSYPLGHTTSGP
ncbi:hypothetical protein FQN54_004101 [Arachnomyces sp. PD_36]|nr:hypothetical protein FQN54_004101 [Arachnomyces sp. PD_36]